MEQALKAINDKYGHATGDEAVLATAGAMEKVLPADSLIARIGGDEFCAFVPTVSQDAMKEFVVEVSATAGRDFKRVAQIEWATLSVSIGTMPCKSKQTFKKVMRQADENLYRKKRERLSKVQTAI